MNASWRSGLKAQSDFERVQLSAKPTLADAETCQQSQAAALLGEPARGTVAAPFPKGLLCALPARSLPE